MFNLKKKFFATLHVIKIAYYTNYELIILCPGYYIFGQIFFGLFLTYYPHIYLVLTASSHTSLLSVVLRVRPNSAIS